MVRTPPMGWALLFSTTLSLGTGCASSNVADRQSAATAGRIVAPVSYAGELPCADCPGIHLTVTLFPDSTFRLRQQYQDRPAVFHDLGRWSLQENGTRLVLRSGAEAPQRFQIVGADSLRMLDSQGQPIQSPFNNVLVRASQVDPMRDTMRLRGLYSYMADAGRFTECASGAAFPVAQLGANAALERAYLTARHEPGAPLPVAFRGHFAELPAMEGDQRVEHVVVDSVERVPADSTCEVRMSNTTVKGTHWTLLEVGGTQARVAENIAQPSLQLDTVETRASGSTGCNSFSGSYELTGDSLRFGPLASTRRACLDPAMNRQESVYLKALSDTRRWRVTGDTLILSGDAGPVARFSARRGY